MGGIPQYIRVLFQIQPFILILAAISVIDTNHLIHHSSFKFLPYGKAIVSRHIFGHPIYVYQQIVRQLEYRKILIYSHLFTYPMSSLRIDTTNSIHDSGVASSIRNSLIFLSIFSPVLIVRILSSSVPGKQLSTNRPNSGRLSNHSYTPACPVHHTVCLSFFH